MFRTIRGLHGSVRLWNNPFLYAQPADLALKIKTNILTPEKVLQETVQDALKACREVQQTLYEGDKFERDPNGQKVEAQIQTILECEKVDFNSELLRKIFLMKFPGPTAVNIISTYYKRNPKAVIDMTNALIPFRKSIFDADLHSALKITDMTTAHPNYIAKKHADLRKGVLQLAATAIGITFFSKVGVQLVIDWGLLLPGWKHLGSINAMILTYILNLSFFVTIVKFGRKVSAAGGDFLTWQKGTFYTHWYKHSDEMAMCAKIMDADLKLNGGLENSPWLVEELCRPDESDNGATLQPGYTRHGQKIRLLEPKDNLEDLKLQAYWMSGGDGFEWVEPDQDPAEIIWRDHLKNMHVSQIKAPETKSLKWAEELIEEK